jgi:hypothetical protein
VYLVDCSCFVADAMLPIAAYVADDDDIPSRYGME